MGSRRLGRKRLVSLDKLGQSDTITQGDNAPKVTRQTIRREGNKIITEIAVDLGDGRVHGDGTDGRTIAVNGATTGTAIATLTLATHGYIAYAECVCVEAPTVGTPDIKVMASTSADNNQGAAPAGGVDLVDPAAAWTLGLRKGTLFSGDSGVPGTAAHIVLVEGDGAGAGTYATGKLLITIEGIASDAVPDA